MVFAKFGAPGKAAGGKDHAALGTDLAVALVRSGYHAADPSVFLDEIDDRRVAKDGYLHLQDRLVETRDGGVSGGKAGAATVLPIENPVAQIAQHELQRVER